jgi:hypothetical protein
MCTVLAARESSLGKSRSYTLDVSDQGDLWNQRVAAVLSISSKIDDLK